MLELVKQGGWLMLPIIFCSIVAAAICIERVIALNQNKIAPTTLLAEVWGWIKNNQWYKKNVWGDSSSYGDVRLKKNLQEKYK